MFGGLDLKGSAGSAPVKPSGNNDESAPAPAVSAFSFLMGNTASTTTSGGEQGDVSATSSTTAGNSSAFSFLSSPPPTTSMNPDTSMIPSPTDGNTISSTGLSSFSFMTTTQEKVTSTVPGTTTANELPPTSVPTPSSFDFLQTDQSTATDASKEGYNATAQSSNKTQTANSIATTVVPPTTTSVFDFMSSSLPTAPAGYGTPVMTHNGATNATAPAGTGIVFGNAAVAPKAAVKKRTRTAKIGAAAQQVELPAPTPAMALVPSSSVPVVGTSQNTVDVRDAASAAAQRAELFLRSKQEADATAVLNIRSVPSEDDDVIVAAKAAAKEAQKLSAKSHSSGGVGFSSLFRSRSTNKNTSDSFSVTSATQQPAVSLSASSASIGSTEQTPMESSNRFQKEHDTVAEKDWRQEILSQSDDTTKGTSISKDYDVSSVDKSSAFVPPTPSIPTSGVRSLMTSFAKATPPVALDVMSTPKQKTPKDIFEDMLHAFRGEVVKSMTEVTRLRQHRTGLLEERFVTNAKERLAVQQKKQAEMHQITAAENEDFDLADQMSATIDRYSREQAEYSAILENIGRAIVELDQHKVQCVENVTNCFVNIQTKMRAFQKEQESADTKNASEALSKFKATSKQLSIEQERLQNDLKHIERDSELISDERKELEKAISEQSGEYEKLRDQARSRLTAVEDEIEELRKQLQQKQKEAAELRTEAAGHDESVLKVRVKFARQLTRLQKKEMTIKDNKDEWEAEKRSFETNKQQHDDQVRDHSEAMLARDSLLDMLGKEIDMSDTFTSIVAKEIGFEVNAGNDEPECDDDMAQMQANVVKCEAAVSESRNALKVVTLILKNLEDEVQGLEMQLPVLEDIKKRAAEKRDFKGASKASKEIKEASMRLAECNEEIEKEIIRRKEAAVSDLEKLEVELEKARTVANEMERESGMASMTRLADNIKSLLVTKKSVCGSSNELSVSGVGAFVLEAQIKVLMLEGQAYGDKYGCWTELISDMDLSSPDEPVLDDNVNHRHIVASAANTALESDNPIVEVAEVATSLASEFSVQEKMRKFRDVSNRLKECEDELEASVASEDFEKAAELDEALQQLLAEVQALNMTDEEMEAALTSDVSEDTSIAVQNGSQEDKSPLSYDPKPANIDNINDVETPSSPETTDEKYLETDETPSHSQTTSNEKTLANEDSVQQYDEKADSVEDNDEETPTSSETSNEKTLVNADGVQPPSDSVHDIGNNELENGATLESLSNADAVVDPAVNENEVVVG